MDEEDVEIKKESAEAVLAIVEYGRTRDMYLK